jgi:hypothetical protein
MTMEIKQETQHKRVKMLSKEFHTFTLQDLIGYEVLSSQIYVILKLTEV